MSGTAAASGAIVEIAPAKINLYLHLAGRRADGYHLISSLTVFADCGDELRAAPAASLTLSIEGPFASALPDPADNLVTRAARKLAETGGVAALAALHLTKRLPVASGIGGGSTDAAAALRALARLWRLDLDTQALARIGLELGADLPVCLHGKPALVSGIGEIIEPAPPLPKAWLVLVNPGVAVATRDVFAARTGAFAPVRPLTDSPRDLAELAAMLAERGNDLAEPAQRLAPVIGEVQAALTGTPGCLIARMSGSGATCFGLFADADRARAAARSIAAVHPRWWCQAAAMRA